MSKLSEMIKRSKKIVAELKKDQLNHPNELKFEIDTFINVLPNSRTITINIWSEISDCVVLVVWNSKNSQGSDDLLWEAVLISPDEDFDYGDYKNPIGYLDDNAAINTVYELFEWAEGFYNI